MSAPANSIAILVAIDAALAIAVAAALLIQQASRAIALAAGIAAVLGIVVGALVIGDQSSAAGRPGATDIDQRIGKLEQKTDTLEAGVAANRAALSLLTATKPSSPSGAKLVIASAQRIPPLVWVKLQNRGTERVNITAGEAYFCPATEPAPPQLGNCVKALKNEDCPQTFLCPIPGMTLDAGQVSVRKSATIRPPYTSGAPFRIALNLKCKDKEGHDCSLSLVSDPLQAAPAGPRQSGAKSRRGRAPAARRVHQALGDPPYRE